MLRHLPILAFAFAFALCACQSTDDTSAPPPAEMDPEAMMELMMEFAELAPQARKLDPLIGEFTSTIKYWGAPDAPPSEGTGTARGEWILGGRFLALHYTGGLMGMPFEGVGWIGYDKLRESYVSAWIDNFGTWMMDPAEGHASEDGKSISFLRSGDSPSGPLTMREVYHLDASGGYAMDMYMVNPDGSEIQSMRIENTAK